MGLAPLAVLAFRLRAKPPRSVGVDELHSAALIGIWRATGTYRPGKSPWRQYALWQARHGILDYLREVDFLSRTDRRRNPRLRQRTGAVDLLTPDRAENTYDKPANSADPREPWEHPLARDVWEHLERRLPPVSRLILRRYFRDGWTLKRIGAEELGGITESSASQRLSSILRTAREVLEARR